MQQWCFLLTITFSFTNVHFHFDPFWYLRFLLFRIKYRSDIAYKSIFYEKIMQRFLVIVRKGVPAPILWGAHPLTQLVPFLESLLPLPSFLFHPLLRYFRQSPHLNTTPFCPHLTHQPSLHVMNGFKQISNGWFYQFNSHFLSKMNFWFFKSLCKCIRLF